MIYSSFSLFLIHLWIGFVSCAVYSIVPSPSHHYPVESCLTLSSFADNTNLYLDFNTSLIVQPGNHTMHSRPIYVRNVINFSMTSYSSKRSSAGIICESSSWTDFIFKAINHVYVSNLNFFGCKHINLANLGLTPYSTLIEVSVSNLILQECTFEDNEGIRVISATHSYSTKCLGG